MMVRPKKGLGQHFLWDKNIALKIAEVFKDAPTTEVLEVGPGRGALTGHLLESFGGNFYAVEIDRESFDHLLKKYPQLKGHLVLQDFLKMDLSGHFKGPFSVIGNFPYNISGQILFKVLEHRNQIPFLVGMFQKEVAERISAPPGTKVYGKLSVLLQAYYDIKILFQVGPQSFSPSPKVRSSVVQMKRNNTVKLDCDEGVFFRLVKQGFSQRRKVLGNSLKSFLLNLRITDDRLKKRPEQLTVKDFVELTRMLQQDRIRT